jgi:hypothetical protein
LQLNSAKGMLRATMAAPHANPNASNTTQDEPRSVTEVFQIFSSQNNNHYKGLQARERFISFSSHKILLPTECQIQFFFRHIFFSLFLYYPSTTPHVKQQQNAYLILL